MDARVGKSAQEAGKVICPGVIASKVESARGRCSVKLVFWCAFGKEQPLLQVKRIQGGVIANAVDPRRAVLARPAVVNGRAKQMPTVMEGTGMGRGGPVVSVASMQSL